jgi:hypothetical protein
MMMYNQKLAIAIKSHGKVLREHQDTVYLPFGSEYSILIKNLNSVKALVKVEIDGTDVGGGEQFIVNGNSEVELERFIVNGTLDQGNRFKFIERTENIENNRGIKVDDGLIRVSFQYEQMYDVQKILREVEEHHHHHHHYDWHQYPPYNPYSPYYTCGGPVPASTGKNTIRSRSLGEVQCNANISGTAHNSNLVAQNTNDAGITVPGSVSNQQFTIGKSFVVESTEHVMILHLRGELDFGKKIEQPKQNQSAQRVDVSIKRPRNSVKSAEPH